ncbi:signal transduction histidine kinase [Kribbella aluminosa]|uniref:histidine kinase n=1 Tax=Kribbella aluminosa TaxID=416017 RepID=A0ABS4UX51_9ACTN|nr:ATP-binding protein [Kribbella aluminosa]MBP2356238.1 signal transduction histidine kinase [Kribbella aluminosa]
MTVWTKPGESCATWPPAELAAGLPDALRKTCERLSAHSDLKIHVQVHGTPVTLDSEVETALLRTARGAVANVLEHAHADSAFVTLTYHPDAVVLDVVDNGRGLPRSHVKIDSDRGHGLAGIRERLRQLGGTLVLESEPGDGTALAASIPLKATEDG